MKSYIETRVSEALSQVWEPVADAVGIDEIEVENNEDRLRVIEEYQTIDNKQWSELTATLRLQIRDIATVDSDEWELVIKLPDVDGFNLTIQRHTTDDIMGFIGFNDHELEFMSTEDAIEYLKELRMINDAEFDYGSIIIGFHTDSNMPLRIEKVMKIVNYSEFIEQLKAGLLKTAEVYTVTVKEASAELGQKSADKESTRVSRRIEKEKEKQLLAEYANQVEPVLIEAGWNGKYRLRIYSRESGNIIELALKLPDNCECYYMCASLSEIIPKIGEMVNFANSYLKFNKAEGEFVKLNRFVRMNDWKDLTPNRND